MRRAASVRPRSASSTPWQRERDGFDGGRALRDAQHAHDVEAAAAGARHRARTPERGERRDGEHGVGAAAIAGAARRRERLIERRLAGADLAEPRQRQRVHQVRLRLAGGVAERRELLRPRRRPRRPSACKPCGAVSTVSWPVKQVCQARRRAVGGRRGRGPVGRTAVSRTLRQRSREAASSRSPPRADVAGGSSASHQSSASSARAGSSASRRSMARPSRLAASGTSSRASARRPAAARRCAARSPRLRPCASSGPSSRRSWCACSRCQPMVSSCSAASPTCASIQSARCSCSSARVPLSRRR